MPIFRQLYRQRFGVFAMAYVPGKLIVEGNAAAPVNHIQAFETLFRFGIRANYTQIGPRRPTLHVGLTRWQRRSALHSLKEVVTRGAVVAL